MIYIDTLLTKSRFRTIDAGEVTTGRDYLAKIWELLISCPVGVAIVHEDIAPMTMANIYYELGILDALGRESIVVAVGSPELPSDLGRTEHIPTGRGFDRRFTNFIASLEHRSTYYRTMANNLERNPLLAIDLLRRASLLSEDTALNTEARKVWAAHATADRAKGAVEMLMLAF
ncbi:MAG: hypothetical protein ACREL5_12285 [Gemmatimonadales bacterium]